MRGSPLLSYSVSKCVHHTRGSSPGFTEPTSSRGTASGNGCPLLETTVVGSRRKEPVAGRSTVTDPSLTLVTRGGGQTSASGGIARTLCKTKVPPSSCARYERDSQAPKTAIPPVIRRRPELVPET